MSLYPVASCVGKPTDWWFSPPGTFDHARAVALCDLCPSKHQCATDHAGEPEGLWGGVWRQPSRKHTPATWERRCERCGVAFEFEPRGQIVRCDRCLDEDPATHRAATKRASRARIRARLGAR